MRRGTPFAVGAVAACLIGLEITFTRIYSVVLWYHFAFLAVSVCLFGMGAAGIWLHLAGHRHREEKTPQHLAVYALLLSVFAAAAVVVLLRVRLGSLSLGPAVLARLAGVFLVSALPFFFGGAFLALALRRYAAHVSRLYFADLCGASLGCLAVIPLLSLAGAPVAVVLWSALAAVVAAGIAWKESRPLRTVAATVAACALVLAAVGPRTGLLRVRFSKGNAEPERLVERWNSFSRVIAFPRMYEVGGKTIRDVMLEIDGIAHTPITPFDGDPRHAWFPTFDLSALPFVIRPDADLLIFGSGGGEHILTALPFRPRRITGVEMNPIIVDLVRGRFAKLAGGLFDLPNVRIVVDEGRSFLARTQDLYDVIQFTLVDTWASTVAGGYVLTENNVFTTEAFAGYFDRLKPGGLVSLKRWYKAEGASVEEYTLRLVAIAREVLSRRGVSDFADKFFVAGYEEFANLMVKPDGFTLEETTALLDFCSQHGFEVIYAPFYDMPPGSFHKLVARDAASFVAGYPFDISPVTDDRPFFFYTLRLRDLPRVLSLAYSAKVRNIGPVILLGLLLVVLGVTGAFLLLPLLFRQAHERVGGRRESLKFGAYFGLIGLGFLLVEIALMARFILFLGHPIYSLSVILFSILLFGGLGAGLSGLVPERRRRLAMRAAPAFLIVYAGLLVFLAPHVFAHLQALAPLAKAAFSVALLAPAGLALGMPFPLGVQLLASCDERLVPWMWAVNSAASVLGSVLAMVLAVHLGFSATIAAGLVCYLVVAILV